LETGNRELSENKDEEKMTVTVAIFTREDRDNKRRIPTHSRENMSDCVCL